MISQEHLRRMRAERKADAERARLSFEIDGFKLDSGDRCVDLDTCPKGLRTCEVSIRPQPGLCYPPPRPTFYLPPVAVFRRRTMFHQLDARNYVVWSGWELEGFK